MFVGRGKVQVVVLFTLAEVTDPDTLPQVTVRFGMSVGVKLFSTVILVGLTPGAPVTKVVSVLPLN